MFGDRRTDGQDRRTTQGIEHGLQTCLRVLVGIRLGRIGVDREVDFAQQIVYHGQLFGQHQVQIGNADIVRRCAVRELVLDFAHGVVGEIADQAATVARMAIEFRHIFALQKGAGEFE